MNIDQHIIYSDNNYRILDTEQEFMLHPAALGLLPVSKTSLQSSFSISYYIDNYCLMLDKIIWNEEITGNEKKLEQEDIKLSYSGVILIGANPVKEYYLKGDKLACFSYQNVMELVFEKGMLITTIDQSKAMLRIRKNIELKLRSLNKGRDVICIRHFIWSSLVGDYKPFLFSGQRYKYLQEMRNDYSNVPVIYPRG